MKRRDRLIAAVNHQETDFCPHNIFLTWQANERLTEYTKNPNYLDEHSNNHICGISVDNQTEIKPGFFKDTFGVIWDKTGADKDIGVIRGQVLPDPDISLLKLPQLDEKNIRASMKELADSDTDMAKIFFLGFSMYERAWTLRGMEDFLCDMVQEETFTFSLMEKLCDFNSWLLDIALDYDIDGVYFGDDWGQQKGLIMGPQLWRKYLKPYFSKMFAKVKSKNKLVLLHSCGDIKELFPDLIDIGLDIYNTFQPEIYDFKEFKQNYGKNLTVWGGISTQRDLPFMTPDKVKKLTYNTIKIMGAGGGYIASPTHGIEFDVPPENIIALIEAFNNQ